MQDQETTDNPYASKKSAYYALVLLTIVYSFNFIDRQLLAILQESVKADLDLSDSQLGPSDRLRLRRFLRGCRYSHCTMGRPWQ